MRPIANADLVCPVDGAISQFGRINKHTIFQAKGHEYTTQALLGGDAALAEPFLDGSFATLYLSPKDYHRIHMPCDGRLTRMIHVPGDLFSVNPVTAQGVPGLWARNERVVCLFEGPRGPFSLVLVGATIVGSMQTVWHGVVNAKRPGQIREWRYDDQDIVLKQGDEMGRFLLGLDGDHDLPQGRARVQCGLGAGAGVRLGEAMANYRRLTRSGRPARSPTQLARHDEPAQAAPPSTAADVERAGRQLVRAVHRGAVAAMPKKNAVRDRSTGRCAPGRTHGPAPVDRRRRRPTMPDQGGGEQLRRRL